MATPLDLKRTVNITEIAISRMYEIDALIEVVVEKGIVTQKELLDKIKELRARAASVT